MIELQNVSANAKDFEKIKQLYECAFPYEERLPIFNLLENKNETTFCAIYDNELFCGFFCLLSFADSLSAYFQTLTQTLLTLKQTGTDTTKTSAGKETRGCSSVNSSLTLYVIRCFLRRDIIAIRKI